MDQGTMPDDPALGFRSHAMGLRSCRPDVSNC